jgi:hypothetical protein
MKRISLLLAAFAVFAVACSGPTPTKLGIVTPPSNTVNYDPSTVDGGLAAAVGFRVFNPLGTQAWDKTGSAATDWTSVPTPAASPTKSGLFPASQALAIQGGAPVGFWITPTIDFTQATSITAFNTPLAAGKKFNMVAGRLYILTRDAALTTGLTWQISQNGSAVSGSVASATATIDAQAAPNNVSASPSSMQLPAMDSFPLQFQVTVGVAGSGLTTCTGFYVISGFYQ